MTEPTISPTQSKWRWLRILFSTVVCLVILGCAVAAVIVINQTEPTAEKRNTTRKSSALVETITVHRGTHRPKIQVLGTVQSAQQIVVSPRVSGQVIELAGEFAPGGMVNQGELLVRIDPADFENALSISQSQLRQAEASMEIELARQQLAEKELKLLEGSITNTNRGLVMREPQIASIKAEVAAAEAGVERANLDLERTRVHAPFDAQVLTRTVDIGSQVGPGDELGQLVGLEEYWIMAAVPVRSLRWVQFPRDESQLPRNHLSKVSEESAASNSNPLDVENNGSQVILRNPETWGVGVERVGQVARLIGTLDQQTRLARVLITVADPLGRDSDLPPLIINTLVETEIQGRLIDNVFRLKREYLRDQDTVWVMQDGKLEIRQTEIVFRDAEYAYLERGLEDGDEVVTTTLATVAEGIGLKKVEPSAASPNTDSRIESPGNADSSAESDPPAETDAPTDKNAPADPVSQTASIPESET